MHDQYIFYFLQDVQEAWVMPKVVDITKKTKSETSSSNQLVEEFTRLHNLQLKTQQLQVTLICFEFCFVYNLFKLCYISEVLIFSAG